MSEFLALLLLVVAAVPISLVLLRGAAGVFASSVVTGLLATVAGFLHVASGIPIAIVWLALIAVCYILIVAIPAIRARLIANVRAGLSRTDVIELALVAGVVIVAVSLVPAPLGWDARSIWLFHASWFNAGPSAFLGSQTLDATTFSHPDYPFLGPATMAVAWGLAGGAENLVLGVQVIALLSVLVIALGASVLVARYGRGGSPVVTTLAFFAYVTAAFAIGGGVVTQGYMDPLQAGFVTALVAVLVTSISPRPTASRIALTTVIALGAINVKQEGFWFAAAGLGVFLVLSLRDQYLTKYVPLVLVVLSYAGWKLFLLAIDSHDTSDVSGLVAHIPELADPSSEAWSILGRIATQELRGLPSAALLMSVVLLVSVAIARRSARVLQRVALVAITPIAIFVVVLLTYALGDTRTSIDWWLTTSFDRVIATTQLLAWLGVFFAVLMLSPWRRPVRPLV